MGVSYILIDFELNHVVDSTFRSDEDLGQKPVEMTLGPASL